MRKQRCRIRRSKSLAFSEDTCLEKEKKRAVEGDSKKSWSGIEMEAGVE